MMMMMKRNETILPVARIRDAKELIQVFSVSKKWKTKYLTSKSLD